MKLHQLSSGLESLIRISTRTLFILVFRMMVDAARLTTSYSLTSTEARFWVLMKLGRQAHAKSYNVTYIVSPA